MRNRHVHGTSTLCFALTVGVLLALPGCSTPWLKAPDNIEGNEVIERWSKVKNVRVGFVTDTDTAAKAIDAGKVRSDIYEVLRTAGLEPIDFIVIDSAKSRRGISPVKKISSTPKYMERRKQADAGISLSLTVESVTDFFAPTGGPPVTGADFVPLTTGINLNGTISAVLHDSERNRRRSVTRKFRSIIRPVSILTSATTTNVYCLASVAYTRSTFRMQLSNLIKSLRSGKRSDNEDERIVTTTIGYHDARKDCLK